MQEYRPEDMPSHFGSFLSPDEVGEKMAGMREFFTAETTVELKQKMDAAANSAEGRGFIATNQVKIGRNDICPCGSGEKFKKCCLNLAK